MKILVVAATKAEVEPLIQHYVVERLKSNLFYASSAITNFELYILISGVGMISTVFQLSNFSNLNDFDLVLNVGIGGLAGQGEIGSVFHVIKETVYEFGAETSDSFIPIQKLNLLKEDDFPLNEDFISIGSTNIDEQFKSFKKAHGISVNRVHGNSDSIHKLMDYIVEKKITIPVIESMEGAAAAYVCSKLTVPFAELRSISNRVEIRNKNNWNIPLAISSLNKEVILFVEHYY